MKTINSNDEKERITILRERALDVLRSQGSGFGDSSEKLNRVIHELQVHQIELELQNEELQRTQRALERSHSRYSDLYDRAPVGYFSLNKRGTIISANITGAGLLGVARETLIGQRLSQFIARADQDEYYLYRRALFRCEGSSACEIRVVRYDGSGFDARLERVTVCDEEQLDSCSRVAMIDISEKKKAFEALHSSQTFLNSIYSGTDLSIYVIDVTESGEFRYAGVNPTFERVNGYRNADLRGKRLHELWPEFSNDAYLSMQTHYARCVGLGTPIEIEQQIMVGGQERWWLVRLEPLKNDQKRVYRLIGTAIPITERKQTEKELNRLAAIVESSDDAIIGCTLEGTITSWNQGAEKIFGYQAHEVIRQPISILVPSERLYELFEIFEDLKKGQGVTSYKTDQLAKDGRLIHISLTISPILDQAGQIKGVSVIARDISESTRISEELALARRRLAENQEAERHRLARELHDEVVQQLIGFRYELVDVRRRANDLYTHNRPSEQLTEVLAGLDEQVLSVVRQVRRVISNLRPAGLEEFGLTTALNGVIAQLKRESRLHVPTIHAELDECPRELPQAITLGLFRVAQEALRNALKHAQANHITIILQIEPTKAILQVTDDGQGFNVPTHLAELAADNHFGLIGMSERVSWVDGTLTIRSTPQEGTQVVAEIPLIK